MSVGFTGTQRGMERVQRLALFALLLRLRSEDDGRPFHHGCCIGADAESSRIALELGYRLHAHPPRNEDKLDRESLERSHVVWPALEYLDRNAQIVAASELLIAAPRGVIEQLRSGTWATVRRARKAGIPVWIVHPDGAVSTSKALEREGQRGKD
jgi:hypothetical protein